MRKIPLGYKKWIAEAKPNFRADLIAGLTLWAMIVPEAVAYANLSNAPTSAAGLYGIIIVLPIYAIFASSRYVVATSTSAISVTMAGFLAVMSSQDAGDFAALVMFAAIGYLIFYYFKLGFVADFISEPVSRGFMFGLGAFIIVGQMPKLFGVKGADGNTFEQFFGLIQNLSQTNLMTLLFAIVLFAILIGVRRINPKIPAGLLAIALAVAVCYFFDINKKYGVDMVGALPEGFPKLVLPKISLSDIGVVLPAAIGLVILGASESTVLGQSLAQQHGQELDEDQQFLAFGIANFFGGLFGGLLGTGSTSSTMVNHEAGAKTLISTIWASAVTILTVLFLTGVFAYLPEVFLGVLIIHSVYHLLRFRKILNVRSYSHGEFYLAGFAALAVLLFDVLSGLLISMIINMFYLLVGSAKVRMAKYGYTKEAIHMVGPMSLKTELLTPPDDVLILGLERGQIFYGSAGLALTQTIDILKESAKVKTIVFSFARMDQIDYSSRKVLEDLQDYALKSNRQVYIINVNSPKVMEQLKDIVGNADHVHLYHYFDVTKLWEK